MSFNPNEQIFLNALRNVKQHGSRRETRNGITDAILAHQMRFDMRKGFPVLTTKFIPFRLVTAENLWFLDAGKETSGRLSLQKFNEFIGKPADAKNIWTMDQARFAADGKAQFSGDCGRIYGAQWRDWTSPDGTKTDQIAKVIKQLKGDPFSRYHVVNAWNPGEVNDMCLPPCHMKFQFFVRPSMRRDKKMYLDISMGQRSCDLFLGVPFNIAGYALILHMIAQCVDMVPGELVMTLEDCHIYRAGYDKDGNPDKSKDHMKAVNKQLANEPLKAPKLWLNPEIKDIDAFTMNDIKLLDYTSHEKIPADLL